MDIEGMEYPGVPGPRQRTFSGASQQSQQSSKQNFPLMTSDSGLYTCSSNTSDCSLQLESDTDFCHQSIKFNGVKDERLQLALQDVRKLRSELERLTKSEQWYKQELRQQKSLRLDDLERIYTQERKFMQENQRLQKECVRLYEKCNELERDLEKQTQESQEHHMQYMDEEENLQTNVLQIEKEQQMALIKDQQQLISVLRKQKRDLLEDLRCLTEEKDEKVLELQRLLADLEYENKLITKKCTQFAKERLNLENNFKQSNNKLSQTLEEKFNLQKSIVDLKEQLDIQNHLLKIKESEIDHLQQHYTQKIEEEEDLDQVHKLSVKYQEEINAKTLEVINLKERLQEMQDEIEKMQNLQDQNDMQQRQIDQLNFSLEAYRIELQELKTLEQEKNKQLEDLHLAMDQLINDKNLVFKTSVEQQNDYLKVKQALKYTQERLEQVQELYIRTQFKLELLEIEQGKVKFQNVKDQQEIEHLRNKLKVYLQQTTELSDKIKYLEQELSRVLDENLQLKQASEELRTVIQDLKENALHAMQENMLLDELAQIGQEVPTREKILSTRKSIIKQDTIQEDTDLLELQLQCKKFQANIDFTTDSQTNFDKQQVLQTLNDLITKFASVQKEGKKVHTTSNKPNENIEQDLDFVNLSLASNKLQENLNNLNDFLLEKHQLLNHLNKIQDSNEGIEKLVKENEILKKKLNATETEAFTLKIKQDINERTQKYSIMTDELEIHKAKAKRLQENLLKNDAKLYKLERKLEALDKSDVILQKLQFENEKLRELLEQEQVSKTELYKKLENEAEKLTELKQTLHNLKLKQKSTKNHATQCFLDEISSENSRQQNAEIMDLKERVLQLQQQQSNFLDQEAIKKDERLKIFHKIMDLQNNKMQNLQQHQQDWEEMLISLNKAQSLEEATRKELELKRMELEELNQVFEDQNEELRKLEEFTNLLEIKRQQEKEHLKLTFQQEINVMRHQLKNVQQEVEQQKQLNDQLEKRNETYKHNNCEDYAKEVAEYKKEIRELKGRISRIMEEKQDLLEHLKELEQETKNLRDNKREAFIIPDLSLIKMTDIAVENPVECVEVLKQNISEDHLRILTKVLEAEYQRKMQRYDEHIHSLLSNLKSLKKSLKINEEKTDSLSEEHLKTQKELKDLQKTKINLEEMRLKYEQSQNTIKELKQSLALERNKFQLSDLGNSSQNNINSYEVSNLIDDYKKLIQQSAAATKRPSTSAILDLIQRSNQCVPNLHILETNVEGLRCELQNFLTSYNHKIPTTSLIAAASLSVPPSLLDELRAASDGF